jgi:ribosomal protein S8E
MDVEEVVFTVKGAGSNLKKSLASASLYLDDKLIATNSSSDITVPASSDNTQAIATATTTTNNSGTTAVAQISTVTPGGTIEVGDIFTATINSTDINYVATGTTVANVTAGLTAAINNNPAQSGSVSATDS